MSSLSNAVNLLNVTETPTAPTSVSTDYSEVCNGSGVILTYTGGSGNEFVWYTGSCGDVSVGTGNNLSLIVNTETTYFGRWENACGVSDCEQITIGILDETNIITQPEDVNTSAGSDVSFSVTAEGDNVTYQWQKNSSDISGATDAIYTINNVQVSDAGDYDVIVNGTCGNLTSETATLSVSSSLEDIKENLFTVFPNPSKGIFTINFSKFANNVEIEILNITGKTIFNSYYQNVNSEIHINSVPKGLYFIKLIIDNKSYAKKLIIN